MFQTPTLRSPNPLSIEKAARDLIEKAARYLDFICAARREDCYISLLLLELSSHCASTTTTVDGGLMKKVFDSTMRPHPHFLAGNLRVV